MAANNKNNMPTLETPTYDDGEEQGQHAIYNNIQQQQQQQQQPVTKASRSQVGLGKNRKRISTNQAVLEQQQQLEQQQEEQQPIDLDQVIIDFSTPTSSNLMTNPASSKYMIGNQMCLQVRYDTYSPSVPPYYCICIDKLSQTANDGTVKKPFTFRIPTGSAKAALKALEACVGHLEKPELV